MDLNKLIKEVETRKDKTKKVEFCTYNKETSWILRKIQYKKDAKFIEDHFQIIEIK